MVVYHHHFRSPPKNQATRVRPLGGELALVDKVHHSLDVFRAGDRHLLIYISNNT